MLGLRRKSPLAPRPWGDEPGIIPAEQLNQYWTRSFRGKQITVPKRSFLNDAAKVFAIGSCFAREIRTALRGAGYDVLPRYLDIRFDSAHQHISKMPGIDGVNHYTTFSVLQEIERAISGKRWTPDDFFQRHRHPIAKRKGWASAWQDPYRLNVFADSEHGLSDISDALGRCVAEGIASADVIIITLGLTEAWRNRRNGKFVCVGPNPEDNDLKEILEFVPSSFAENLSNVSGTVSLLRSARPGAQIVLTVSPVSLASTFTGQDIVVANMTSKSILRAVAAEVCRRWPEIIYWPSYEFASRRDVFLEDGRHVHPDAVAEIIGAFVDSATAHR